MSANLRAFTQAVYAFDAVAQRVPDDAWDSPSPCQGWTARQVAGHVIWATLNVAAMAGDAEAPRARPEAEVAGDDPLAAWASARDAALEALDHEGALQQEGPTPFGEISVDRFLGIYAVDPLIHAWDLGQATGVPAVLEPALCDRYSDQLAKAGDAIRGPGMFDAAVDLSDDADPVARLVAMAGRDPR